ncbi:DUF3429 domain-containing protein [Aestuariivirga sp.]|uniref:DUF3429 domain-containing protein n=1 Tax=Aestuariivirga sp. TaxID=2650926 RepID=UPI0039E3F522
MSGNSRIPALPLVLGLAGVLPFLAAALSQWMPLGGLAQGQGIRGGIAYGAVVLSFLGGIRWGKALGDGRTQDFFVSIIPALAGWLAILLPQPLMGVGLLIAGFMLQAMWDVKSADSGQLPRWFGTLRAILSAGAVISLLAMLVPLI